MATQVRSVRRNLESTASARQLPPLTDDLLEEILLRIGCPANLARASAACVSFRRLITDRIFLRRYRSRHPPLLLGFVNVDVAEGFHAVTAPHPNATAARALANVSFDYLCPRSMEDWYVSDVRDGRVLFGYFETVDDSRAIVTGLVVCDPSSASRRYLPPVPLPEHQVGDQDLRCFVNAFAPYGQEEDDETLFRVINIVFYQTKAMILVFNSASSNWTVGTSTDALGEFTFLLLMRSGYAYGCLYWKVDYQSKLLKLDINRMELSTVDLPPGHSRHGVVVVEAGEGSLGMFSYTPRNGKFLNYYKSKQYDNQRTNEWKIRNVIPLPVLNDLQIDSAPQGYLFIQGDSKVQDTKETTIYSLDIKTLKFEMITQMRFHFRGHPYFGFPPSISPRRI